MLALGALTNTTPPGGPSADLTAGGKAEQGYHGSSSHGSKHSSAFERSRHSAVLLMERQLQQLQQEVQESRGLRARQADVLAALQAQHEQQLADAQVCFVWHHASISFVRCA